MNEVFANLISSGGDIVNKYLPIYLDWLTKKLGGANPFGTLSLVGFLAMFFLLIYVYVRNTGE